MNFVTIQYCVFLAVVFVLWNLLPFNSAKKMLLVACLLFYAYWFPPHLLILVSIGALSFLCAKKIDGGAAGKKSWLVLDVVALLSGLFFFKYYNFFLDSLGGLERFNGLRTSSFHLDILLPLGISFYTFQNISYVVDVYRGKMKSCESLLDFFLCASFFPAIQAGPIVRVVDLAPQMRSRVYLSDEDIKFVVYRLSRGFFLKSMVANNISRSVIALYKANPESLTVFQAWCAAVFFTIQIFCDFAGYSDIAIGSARLLGFRLKENFDNPYLASSLSDFWKRWHISLTSWFRDYLYIALGGNRVSKARTYINIGIVFLVSGLWHGANWTFIFWGFIHGVGLIAERLLKTITVVKQLSTNTFCRFFYRAFVLVVVAFAWVPFKCETIGQAFAIWKKMLFVSAGWTGLAGVGILGLGTMGVFLIYQINEGLKHSNIFKAPYRYLYIEALIYVAFATMMRGDATNFIYFQF